MNIARRFGPITLGTFWEGVQEAERAAAPASVASGPSLFESLCHSGHLLFVLRYLLESNGITLSEQCAAELEKDPRGFRFAVPDFAVRALCKACLSTFASLDRVFEWLSVLCLQEAAPRVKYMSIISFAQGKFLVQQASSTDAVGHAGSAVAGDGSELAALAGSSVGAAANRKAVPRLFSLAVRMFSDSLQSDSLNQGAHRWQSVSEATGVTVASRQMWSSVGT